MVVIVVVVGGVAEEEGKSCASLTSDFKIPVRVNPQPPILISVLGFLIYER